MTGSAASTSESAALPPSATVSSCPVCTSATVTPFVEASALPVHVGVLWADREAARRCPRGDVRLAFCGTCGHVYNRAYDPGVLDYEQDYDNSLHASTVFRTFEAQLVARLARPDLRGALVVEIGPGDGRFLRLVTEAATCRGLGFEPGLTDEVGGRRVPDVEIRGTSFSVDAIDEWPRLICCRQVLEHIERPTALVRDIHKVLRGSSGGRAYIEVPNSDLLLSDLSIWDLVYEHCHYFVAESLAHLFEAEGFEILDAWASYEGQFLSIEVAPRVDTGGTSPPTPADRSDRLVALREQVDRFASLFAEKTAWWRDHLSSLAASGRRTVLWGGGARAVTFVNLVASEQGLAYAVDINPTKQGTYLAGTGHEIRPPESLRETPPDVVVVLNPIYLAEIRAQLASMGLDPEVLTT